MCGKYLSLNYSSGVRSNLASWRRDYNYAHDIVASIELVISSSPASVEHQKGKGGISP